MGSGLWTCAAVFAAAWGLLAGMAGCSDSSHHPLLEMHAFLFEALEAMPGEGTVFATPTVAETLRARGFPLPPPERLGAGMRSATAFRALDRETRFRLAVLAGPPASYRPLLQYLTGAADWRLVHVDHLSLVFARGEGPGWEPARTDALRDRLPVADRARFLSGVGTLLLEAGLLAEARASLEGALRIGSKDPATLSALAAVEARQGKWDSALRIADSVLERHRAYAPALYVRGQALFALGRESESLAIAEELLRRHPTDPQYLLLHAKAASRSGDRKAEVASLRKLIAQMQEQGLPPGGYRIYLGQALSALHDPEGARREFETALAEGGLNASQIDFARKALERLGGATGARPERAIRP